MTFRDALFEACNKAGTKRAENLKRKLLKKEVKDPDFWPVLETIVRRKYQRQEGKNLPKGAFDWQKLLDWLVKNLPAIISLILALLPLLA
jgi:hypothetical protein